MDCVHSMLNILFCCIHVLLVSLLLVMCSFFLPLHCLFNQSKRIFISQFLFVFLFSLKEVYVDGMCVVKHYNNNFVEKYITMYEACIMQSIHIETWSYLHNKGIKLPFRRNVFVFSPEVWMRLEWFSYVVDTKI